MLFFVVVGGGLGAAARYGLAGLVHRLTPSLFPWGTLTVNLLGSFVIGLLFGLFEQVVVSPQVRAFLFIGVLGGFTTFSAFGLETVNLFQDREMGLALGNVLLNNVLGIGLVALGFVLARMVLGFVLR